MNLRNQPVEILWRLAVTDARRRGRVGDVDDWLGTASKAWNLALDTASQAAFMPLELSKRWLIKSGTELHAAAREAFAAGASTAGQAFTEMADRAAAAVAGLGGAGGYALQQLLGGKPYDFAWIGAGLLIVLAAGVFLTPAGHVLIGSAPQLAKALV